MIFSLSAEGEVDYFLLVEVYYRVIFYVLERNSRRVTLPYISNVRRRNDIRGTNKARGVATNKPKEGCIYVYIYIFCSQFPPNFQPSTGEIFSVKCTRSKWYEKGKRLSFRPFLAFNIYEAHRILLTRLSLSALTNCFSASTLSLPLRLYILSYTLHPFAFIFRTF